MKGKASNINRHGMTLLEILIVVTLIAILASIVVIKLTGFQDNAARVARRTDVQAIIQALATHFALTGTYPDALEDLEEQITVPGTDPPKIGGPFLLEISFDPTTGQPYEYQKLSDTRIVFDGVEFGN